MGTGLRREYFGHERRGDRPFAADPHRDEETQHHHLLEIRREISQTGENRIHQDRHDHDGTASVFVGERTEEDPSEHAAEQEDPEETVAVFLEIRVPGFDAEDFLEKLVPGKVENLPLVDVEDPPQRGDDEDEPLVAGHPAIPRAGGVVE